MPLLTLRDVRIGIRTPSLLDAASCQIEPGERIGLLGSNGAGKSTLLRVIGGELEPDGGQRLVAAGTRIARLQQDVPEGAAGTVAERVADGLLGEDPDWQRTQRVATILSQMDLDGAAEFAALSSGMKRRVLLAQALVGAPDLLLLDEPTNHLDVDAILWLENFLQRWSGAVVFVTHDRMFLRKIASRIVEIDRGKLFDWTCDYDTFLARKEAWLAAEEQQQALFDKKLAVEEAWLRQGVKARRTRNEGRVRALEEMRRQRQRRRQGVGQAKIAIQEAQRSGALVAELDGASFAYGERPILKDFSATVMRGDKIGIVGPNGAGKTTLLRVLLGQLPPQAGTVRLGTNLQIAYFDQLRKALVDDATVMENVGDGYETVRTAEGNRHIVGYLQDFLFSPDRARTPVGVLSGGERNRVLLAKLFAKPANVLVLDEPTNDLDAETLELLEDRLVQFEGAILVVSHDRAFLNNVATSTFAFEAGGVKEYFGGYDDWLRQRPPPAAEKPAAPKPAATPAPAPAAPKSAKLSYKEQQELAGLPAKIEAWEREVKQRYDTMAAPDYFRNPGERLAADQAGLKDTEAKLAAAYVRWEQLEARSAG